MFCRSKNVWIRNSIHLTNGPKNFTQNGTAYMQSFSASATSSFEPKEGGCACGQVRYRLNVNPMFVHCCHCSWCQRETGSAFCINALVEANQIDTIHGQTISVHTPSESGQGQLICRCPACQVALWSHYAAAKENVSFLRVGTLDDPSSHPPDIHIFTKSKQPWIRLGDDEIPVMQEYYRRSLYRPEDSIIRYKQAIGKSEKRP